jgi:[ribosomal protein S5]-alanine N-acetyltransferase
MTAGLTVPVLPAGPFRLRPFTLDDTGVVREAARDPYIPLITTVPVPCTDGAGRQFIERQWGRAQDGTGYSFAIAEARTDRAVGQIGLWLRDIGQGRATIGYWVAPSARGQHAAGHALTAVARWAFGELGVPRLELCVEPWNAASARTAFITGFRCEGRLRSWRDVGGERKDFDLYAMLLSDCSGTSEGQP